MKKTLLSFFILLFTVHCSLITLQAQAPQGFNYQAVARDGDNNVLKNAALGVKIGFLQGSEPGTLIWEETHSVTTNDLGLFTLKIGDTTAINSGGTAATFADIDWTFGSYYMQVQVNDGTGYVELDSTELLSVPYALFAEAGNVGPQGPQGLQGEQGIQGIQGEPGDPATDDQTLSIAGHQLTISNGNFVNLPDTVNDADHDPTNEIQDLQLAGNNLTITNNASATTINLSTYLDDSNPWTINGDDISYTGGKVGIGTPSGAIQLELADVFDAGDRNLLVGDDSYLTDIDLVNTLGIFGNTDTTMASIKLGSEGATLTGKGGNLGIGTLTPAGRLEVKGTGTESDTIPLFEVKRSDGQTVFAVYSEGVRIYVDDTGAKGLKGGFAVGGFSSSKGGSEYLRVTPDSVRIYIDTASIKGLKGGFAVGGFSTSKGLTSEYLRITDDSVRIYLNNTEGKGLKGGFAVGGYSSSKGPGDDFFRVTNDSTRIYTTGSGGFSVGQIGAGTEKYMSLTTENYFIGHQSGINTTDGIYNSFIGYESGRLNEKGSNNVFLGYQSGYANKFAKNNIYIGNKAGYKTEGIEGDNYSGCHNVFIGYLSGWLNTIGQSNVFVGKQSGFKNDSGRYNTYIGQNCGVQNDDGNFNTFIGAHAGELNTDGSNNVFIGYGAGGKNTTGTNLLFIDNSNTETPLIWGNFSFGSKEVIINGNLFYTGEFGQASDVKFKRNIEPLSHVLSKLQLINGVYFDWREDEYPEMVFSKGRQVGVIAQELEKVFPELVQTTSKGYKTVDYTKISAILIEAVKEQQVTINEMQKQIEILKSTIELVKNNK